MAQSKDPGKLRLVVKIDHALLSKLMKKAIAKVEAADEEKRPDVFAEWVSRIFHDCVRLEAEDVVLNVSKDS